jgi:hypothetical protein
MKRIVMFLFGSTTAMVLASAAIGQTADPQATPPPAASAPATTPAPDATVAQPAPAQAPAQAPAAATAAPAAAPAATSTPAMDRMKERGMKASAKERSSVEKSLDEIEKNVENEATTKGDAEVAGRIGGEFGLTGDALMAERSQYSRGWGEILVAHTLLSNAKTDATLSDLFAMRGQGTGWGVIAAGLDLKLGEVTAAVKSEGRVAMGLEKGDGKPAMIHTLAAGGASKAKGASKMPAAKGDVKAGTSAAGVGVGGGVDLNKGTGK